MSISEISEIFVNNNCDYGLTRTHMFHIIYMQWNGTTFFKFNPKVKLQYKTMSSFPNRFVGKDKSQIWTDKAWWKNAITASLCAQHCHEICAHYFCLQLQLRQSMYPIFSSSQVGNQGVSFPSVYKWRNYGSQGSNTPIASCFTPY